MPTKKRFRRGNDPEGSIENDNDEVYHVNGDGDDYIADDDKPLTEMQSKMVDIYLEDPHRGKYKSYKAAGYKGTGAAGRTSASVIFNYPRVLKAIQIRTAIIREKASDESVVTFEWVMKHLKSIVEFDFRDLYQIEKKGSYRLREIWEMPDKVAKAVSGFDLTNLPVSSDDPKAKRKFETFIKKVKKYDKLKALQMIIELKAFVPREGDLDNKKPEEVANMVREGLHEMMNSVPLVSTPPEAPKEKDPDQKTN